MLLDLLAGRPCEIDVINGAIPPAARELGLAAPGERDRDRPCQGEDRVPDCEVTERRRMPESGQIWSGGIAVRRGLDVEGRVARFGEFGLVSTFRYDPRLTGRGAAWLAR